MRSVSLAVSGVKTSQSPKSCSATSTDSNSSTSPPKSSGAPRLRTVLVFASLSSLSSSLMRSARAGVYHARARAGMRPVIPRPPPMDLQKETPDIFYNGAGRLRSVWRLCVFAVAYFVARTSLLLLTVFGLALLLPKQTHDWLLAESNWGFVIQSVLYFAPAALVGWGCGYALEDLPWRALGWALHCGWLRDALLGLAVGAASVCVAACLGAVAGSYRFYFSTSFDAK